MYFSTRRRKPLWFYWYLVNLWRKSQIMRGKRVEFDDLRFKDAAWVNGRDPEAGSLNNSIQLVLVSTRKDFLILPHAVRHGLRATEPYRSEIPQIIVPSVDVDECKRLMSAMNIQAIVINEEDLISRVQLEKLLAKFGNRGTWVLQQLLKVEAVKRSKASSVLILDSDTLLLNKRPWFDNAGKQILMPSYEYNRAYYEFLSGLGISEIRPDYTYITHHMLMQPNTLIKILDTSGVLELDSLIHYCCLNASMDVQSPLCVEYELYGQYLAKRPGEFFYAQWSNLTIPRRFSQLVIKSGLIRKVLAFGFHSISFHSWS